MHILITGGTGFIGSHLVSFFIKKGAKCTILTREPKKYAAIANEQKRFRHIGDIDSLQAMVDESDAVVNLAGENLFDQRWTEEIKERILSSRVSITRDLAAAISRSATPPDVFLSASAVGIYGNRGEQEITEESELADDFLATVCKQWEEASQIVSSKTRVVNPRIGIALEADGGALKKMLLPFKLFAGGPLGTGAQFFPWIHMQDVCEAIYFAMFKANISGAFNLTAPNPVTMKVFAKTLGKVMGRPSVFSVPEFALKMALGEAAEAIIASQRVLPGVLLSAGYSFVFPTAESALQDLT